MGNDGSTQHAISPEQMQAPARKAAALFVADPANRSALMNISEGLDLEPSALSDEQIDGDHLSQFEIVIADEDKARAIRLILNEQQHKGVEIKPALVAVTGRRELLDEAEDGDFDGILLVPNSASDLAGKLSVVLYAHRALAQRYRSALEELKLNRNIFRSVTNGISVSNAQLPDMPLMYVNPSFEMMSGYSLDEVEGKNCRFLQGGDRDQPGLVLVREALAQKRQTTAVLRNFRKDGTCFWNELTLSPIFNAEGVLTHFVGIQLDVTERVNMESALRESEKLAAAGRLASTISHEINNPLEAVMNLLYLARQLLPENTANSEAAEYLAQADEELKRVKLIAAQSLRFYKQSSGPEAMRIGDVIHSVLDVYGTRASNYEVEIDLRERSTQHIVGLASELRQVIGNLISNAVDAMKAGPRRKLSIRTREATAWQSEKVGVLVTVADTGHGMSDETQAKLYKAFYTTKGISGTGLGLWISSEIVSRHHGHMRVRSSQRSGGSYTVFELFLPFQGASGEASSALS